MNDFDLDEELLLGPQDETRPVPVMPRVANLGLRSLIIGAFATGGLVLGAIAIFVPGKTTAAEAGQSRTGVIRLEDLSEHDRALIRARNAALAGYYGQKQARGGMHFRPDSLDAMKATVAELEQMVRDGKMRPFVPEGTPNDLATPTGETREP